MAHFILIHGFNDRSAGAKNIDLAKPQLEALGHTVDTDTADYGYFDLLAVRFRRHEPLARIVGAIRAALAQGEDVVVVGYSNGCYYALKALWLVFVGQAKVALIHPALSTRFKLSPSVSQCRVFFSRSDWATRMASYASFLIPGWGRAGTVGYRGTDQRVASVDYTDVADGHGSLWQGDRLRLTVQDLDRFARSTT